MRAQTLAYRRRLYLLARVVVQRHYREPLTLTGVARALATSPRQLQRAYEQFGGEGFREDLLARRMRAAAELLIDQPAIAVAQVAPLVGYGHPTHFARAFRRRYGMSPAAFRAHAQSAQEVRLERAGRVPGAPARRGRRAPKAGPRARTVREAPAERAVAAARLQPAPPTGR